MKRIAALALALLLLLSLTPTAAADAGTVTISSREEFLAFASACAEESYSSGRRFVLTADIDLTDCDFSSVPYFAGEFDGGGHTISGLRLTGDGSRQGLIRCTAPGSLVSHLQVTGTVTPGGTASLVGGIVGENNGMLVDCFFDGTVKGIENAGGVVGWNTGSGRLSGCGFTGSVTAEHQVGGIAGKNDGVIADCVNRGSVNTVAVEPAGTQHFDLSAFTEDDFLNIANIGGIAGENNRALVSCVNEGPVGYKHNGYNVGGIAGKSGGYITGCTNHADVTGRRDVGGIVGQLIPYAVWDLSEGKLDEVAAQLGGMQGLLAELNQDAQAMSGDMGRELAILNGYTGDALAAVGDIFNQMSAGGTDFYDGITIDPETGEFSFDDSYYSSLDVSDLTSALVNMEGQAEVMSQMTGGTASVVAEDLTRVSDQMAAIINSLSGALDSMGNVLGETYDLSATETYDHDAGAVSACLNYGAVDSENHSGGIVGTVAFELDFDMENRLDTSRFMMSNAKQYLFAAVRDCGSYSAVSTKDEGAGLIAGTMDIGAVVDCVSLGEARSQNGDYVGGIAGRTAGTVRSCWSRSVLSGVKYVGGIAGSGHDLSACRSWTHIDSAREYQGSVAGWADGAVSDNLYVPDAPAGVDGIARMGQCAAVSREGMLALGDVPQDFGSITVSFVVEGEIVSRQELPFGGSLDTLPEVPNRGDKYWKWDDFDADQIFYSREITGMYYTPAATLATDEQVPRYLVEGRFYEGQTLTVTPYSLDGDPAEEILMADTLLVNDYTDELTVRMYAPEDGAGVLYRIAPDGTRTRLRSRRDGSYLVFTLENGGTVALVHEELFSELRRPVMIGSAAVAGAAALMLALLLSRKKTSTDQAAGNEAAHEKEDL